MFKILAEAVFLQHCGQVRVPDIIEGFLKSSDNRQVGVPVNSA
jgi:hypothetical protein